MARVTDAQAAGERVEALIAELRARAGSQAGDAAEELVGCLVELYGAGLATIVSTLAADPRRRAATARRAGGRPAGGEPAAGPRPAPA